jgi:hypothetical protein
VVAWIPCRIEGDEAPSEWWPTADDVVCYIVHTPHGYLVRSLVTRRPRGLFDTLEEAQGAAEALKLGKSG